MEPLEAWSPMTLRMGVRRQPDGMSEANLQRLHPRRARQKTKWRFDATNPVVRIFPVSKNARFAHVMANFDVTPKDWTVYSS